MTDERAFANSVDSIARARRFAVGAIGDADPEVVDAIAVMVSELATNAVRHAASEFTVAVDADPQQIRVSVADAGDRLPSLRTPEPAEHSGRGLQIVRALADEWGVTENAVGPGKTVWFVLATRVAHDQGRRATSASSASADSSPSAPSAPARGRAAGRSAARPPASGARERRDGGPRSCAKSLVTRLRRRAATRCARVENAAIRVQRVRGTRPI